MDILLGLSRGAKQEYQSRKEEQLYSVIAKHEKLRYCKACKVCAQVKTKILPENAEDKPHCCVNRATIFY